jgi:hypothetical protein
MRSSRRLGWFAPAPGAGCILAPIVHELSVSAIVDRWAEDDPRWETLIAAV